MANGTFDELMEIFKELPSYQEVRGGLKLALAKEIYKERKRRGLSQTELAEMIKTSGEKIDQATISKIESAENDIKIRTYEKVINALGITVTVAGPNKNKSPEKRNKPGKNIKQPRRKSHTGVKVWRNDRKGKVFAGAHLAIKRSTKKDEVIVKPYSHSVFDEVSKND